MSDEDLWRHHAYVYALRRVRLGIVDKTSPIDPNGEWFASQYVDAAERWMRGGDERPRYSQASGPDAVRTTWKAIPASDLTPAERKLARPEIERMTAEAHVNIAKAEAKWKSALRAPKSPTYRPQAEEITVPPATMSDDRRDYLMDLLGKRMGYAPASREAAQ